MKWVKCLVPPEDSNSASLGVFVGLLVVPMGTLSIANQHKEGYTLTLVHIFESSKI